MHYRTLGRSGLEVSVLGLGSGGASLLGQSYELSSSESTRLVRHALDVGVNLIDTAPGYGESEALLGAALVGVPRDAYVMCSKFAPITMPNLEPQRPGSLRPSVETSLRRLRSDYLDVLYLHNVDAPEYAQVCDDFLEEMLAVRDAGLVRYIGISENYQRDHQHAMLQQALRDDIFDVLMVGLNLLSPSAIRSVLPQARAQNVGIVVMCAVRSVLVDPAAVTTYLRTWQAEGRLPDTVDPEVGLQWILDAEAPDVASAAYKFAAADPAVGSVLTGTGRLAHFEANLRAVLGPPLPSATYQRVLDLFGPVEYNVRPTRPRPG